MKINTTLKRDIMRIFALFVAATIMLVIDEPLALYLKRPELAPWLMFAGLALYGTALSHIVRRLFFPYVDLKVVALEARKGSTGAGLVFVGVCVVLAVLLLMMTGLARADVPERAREHLPTLKAEQERFWPDMPTPAVLAAQVEQETCPSLKHRMCWSPRAELRTSRERGVGLGQITKTARFDALAELKASTGDKLAAWSWDDDSIYDARLQLRGLVLKDLQVWRSVSRQAATQQDGLAFMLAGYNGGIGGVLSDSKMCAATPGCDRRRWFGHVEHTSLKAKAAAAGYGKSFFEINREYPRNVLGPRLSRYEGLL